ncbi:LAGLIDADG family homing endonuclease [Candidatus Woesearchaeota archaeon]|nr:LAGLIDADG family homing endonuclease [Candidatus Woesearchaeota archaeon]
MALLPSDVRKAIIQQISEGKSLNSVSRSTGVGKPTIYYYYKKIKGKKYAAPVFKPRASAIEGEICGIFAGDGSQYFEPKKYHYEIRVHFGGKNKWYAEYVKCLFEGFFHKKFRLQADTLGRWRVVTYSKDIFNYFYHYMTYNRRVKHSTIELKSLDLPKRFKMRFLKGLFDTDGCLWHSEKEHRLRVFFTTTSEQLAAQIHSMLNEFGMVNSVYVVHREGEKTKYNIYVKSKGIRKFINAVKPEKANGLVVKPGITRVWQT